MPASRPRPRRARAWRAGASWTTAAAPASTAAKARTPVKARAVARPGTMAAKARTPAKARAVASRASQPTQYVIQVGAAQAAPIHIMPANQFNGFTDYGIGIGLRVPHYQHILTPKPVDDWFEIISEDSMVDAGRQLVVLVQILEQYRVVQHGVSMYFGSADKLNREHLKKLKTLVKRTRTPWLSDHLCWGSVDGRYTHDLLPMPYTFAAAKVTAEKVRAVRDYLEIPIAVENVSSYAEFHASEMAEWEFLTEVVELADCGILLDVNNIYVSSKNHGFDPYAYLNNVPHHRVGQMHVAGHTKFEKYILDTHDHPVLDPVWKMYAHAIERTGRTATLLEWDDKIPSFEEVHNEALKANQFVADMAVTS